MSTCDTVAPSTLKTKEPLSSAAKVYGVTGVTGAAFMAK
jgi:hypothetical protein